MFFLIICGECENFQIVENQVRVHVCLYAFQVSKRKFKQTQLEFTVIYAGGCVRDANTSRSHSPVKL
jgi:hypothetical protein